MGVSALEKVTSTKDANVTFPKSTLELRVLTDDGSFAMTGLTVWNDDARKAQTFEGRSTVVAGLGVVPLDFNQRPGFQTSGSLGRARQVRRQDHPGQGAPRGARPQPCEEAHLCPPPRGQAGQARVKPSHGAWSCCGSGMRSRARAGGGVVGVGVGVGVNGREDFFGFDFKSLPKKLHLLLMICFCVLVRYPVGAAALPTSSASP